MLRMVDDTLCGLSTGQAYDCELENSRCQTAIDMVYSARPKLCRKSLRGVGLRILVKHVYMFVQKATTPTLESVGHNR